MPRLPEGPLSFAVTTTEAGASGEAKILGRISGRTVSASQEIPIPIKGQALIIQTAEGKITAIPAPPANIETVEIGVDDFLQLDPKQKTQVLNALKRSRKMKRQKIGQR